MSTFDLIWILPVMLVMLLLKGFFSGSEIALVNADKIKLAHRAKQGNRGARLVVDLFKRPEQLLTTTLIGTNISTVVFATLGTLVMIHFFGDDLGDLYAFLIFTPLLLILGEIVPKSIYQQKSDELAAYVVFPLRAFAWLFSPLVFIFARVARFAAWLAGGGATSHHMFITRQQLRTVMEMAERASDTAVFDRIRIERAIRFADATVGAEMVPVTEMVAIDNEKTTADAIKLVRRRGYHRLPAYQGDTNNVVGIVALTTWDLLDPKTSQRALAELVRPAHYVSPHDSLEELLPVLRERDDHMAVVVDEYGSTVGMITMDDIIESVVGDIDVGHEFDENSPRQLRQWKLLEDGVYLMDGRLPIHEVNDVLGLDLPASEFHTVAGMLVARLHHLGRRGESVVMSGYRFTVEQATDKTIKSVRVERMAFNND
jgi:CBS domain containing-hemolysin-like protein